MHENKNLQDIAGSKGTIVSLVSDIWICGTFETSKILTGCWIINQRLN
jgi:hypothetical protein